MHDTIQPNTWHALAAELSTTPDAVGRLLATHTAAPGGRCRSCTTAGTGVPEARWPCSIHQLATLAQRIRDGGRAG